MQTETKRILSRVGLCMVVALITLAGFIGVAIAQPKPELNVWIPKSYTPRFDEYLVGVLEEYGEKQGVNVNVTQVPYMDMLPKLTPTIEVGENDSVKMKLIKSSVLDHSNLVFPATGAQPTIGLKSLGGNHILEEQLRKGLH